MLHAANDALGLELYDHDAARTFIADANTVTLVALNWKTPIGIVVGQIVPNINSAKTTMILRALRIHKDYADKRVQRRMIAVLKDIASQLKCGSMETVVAAHDGDMLEDCSITDGHTGFTSNIRMHWSL